MFCVELELPCVCADMFLAEGKGREGEREKGNISRFADVE